MHLVADRTSGCIAARFCWADREACGVVTSGPVVMVYTKATATSGAGIIETVPEHASGVHLLIQLKAIGVPKSVQFPPSFRRFEPCVLLVTEMEPKKVLTCRSRFPSFMPRDYRVCETHGYAPDSHGRGIAPRNAAGWIASLRAQALPVL